MHRPLFKIQQTTRTTSTKAYRSPRQSWKNAKTPDASGFQNLEKYVGTRENEGTEMDFEGVGMTPDDSLVLTEHQLLPRLPEIERLNYFSGNLKEKKYSQEKLLGT